MNTKNASTSDRGVHRPLSALKNGFFGRQIGGFGKKISEPHFFITIALLLVALSSFALGRLSVLEQSRDPIRIEYDDQTATVVDAFNSNTTANSATSGGVVASKTGSVYYFPWCAGALKISEINKVWFASEEKAQALGYRAAANCKGMGK